MREIDIKRVPAEFVPHVGHILMVIFLKLFLDIVWNSFDNNVNLRSGVLTFFSWREGTPDTIT